MSSPGPLPPVVRTVRVKWSAEQSFERFTAGLARWWPLATHSIGQSRAESVAMEPRVGGRIVERIRGGEECTWGTVTAWDPPRAVAFTWHPGQPAETAQLVEVRFEPDGDGTKLTLTHSGWEALGAEAARARKAYHLGWVHVLCYFADRRWHPVALLMNALMAVLGPILRRKFEKEQALAAARSRAS